MKPLRDKTNGGWQSLAELDAYLEARKKSKPGITDKQATKEFQAIQEAIKTPLTPEEKKIADAVAEAMSTKIVEKLGREKRKIDRDVQLRSAGFTLLAIFIFTVCMLTYLWITGAGK